MWLSRLARLACAICVVAPALTLAAHPGARAQGVGSGATHYVGPTRALKLPSDAARIARDFDRVLIDPGVYNDCAVWRQTGISIAGRHPAGSVTIRDAICQGKAIWVMAGDRAIVRNITFRGAKAPDRNGAGIRHERGRLTVLHSRFLENEMGILTNSGPDMRLFVIGGGFAWNGIKTYEGALGHALYANRIASLTVRGVRFRDHYLGHHIKSRAAMTVIERTLIEDRRGGASSYLIDLPDGGGSSIRYNKLYKGRSSSNRSTMISIGAESADLRGSAHYVTDNVAGNALATVTTFVRNHTTTPAVLRRNRHGGRPVRPLVGAGSVDP